MAYKKVDVAYPISEEDEPFAASCTTTAEHYEPETILPGVIQRRTSNGLENSETNEGPVFDLPDTASGITWNDPFYRNNPDVIAAFDFHSNKLQQIYVGQGRFAFYFLIFILLLGLILSVRVEDGLVCWLFLWMPVAGTIIAIAYTRKELFMLGRRHVAVTRCGVYLDEADEPGSSHLAKRTVLKFDAIVSCIVQDTGCARPQYSVVISTRTTTTARGTVVPDYTYSVVGLLNGQTFADLVSAMVEQVTQASPKTGSSCCWW
jgi:hypothetical protein